MICLGQGGEGIKLGGGGGLREGFWGHSEHQWGPPQVKHLVAGGLEVEGGRRSPEADDGGEQVW